MKHAIFTDIHFGKKGPSFNEDCQNFIGWFCNQCNDHSVDEIVFMGDWFHNRFRIDLDTHAIADQCLDQLRAIAPVTLIVGNHDMLYKNNRSVHSLECYKGWDNVTVIDDLTKVDNRAYVPFLVGEELMDIPHLDVDYVFGHFEIPTFMMNRGKEYVNESALSPDEMTDARLLFSGHFHQRQIKENTHGSELIYIGSPFPHDFNDVGRDDYGMAIMEDGEYQFFDWKDGPRYERYTVTEMFDMTDADDFDSEDTINQIIELTNDVDDLTNIDIMNIQDFASEIFREVRWVTSAKSVDTDVEIDIDENMSVGDLVVEQLKQIESRDDISVDLLVSLFEGT